jgi:hypothetical protein
LALRQRRKAKNGSLESIATDAAIYKNLTGTIKANSGREGFLSGQSASTDLQK